MKTIIAGSRDIRDISLVDKAVRDSGFPISEVVCGGAAGVDELGYMWAEARNLPIKMFHADWEKYGRAAGVVRNGEMAEYGEALILVHHNTPGSLDMLRKARLYGLKIFEQIVAQTK